MAYLISEKAQNGDVKYASEMPIFKIAFALERRKNKKKAARPQIISGEMKR
ncbi:hypothetical protein EKTHUN627_34110 [Enterobacter kobei]|jgi:hypothetical protein|nr:hypothetical protein EKTHUN627_34110 [Enterobacter kobei]GJA01752.1 hypothetical protein ECV0102_21000 [Enterobacter cloacae]